jgi:hypothetical protein
MVIIEVKRMKCDELTNAIRGANRYFRNKKRESFEE